MSRKRRLSFAALSLTVLGTCTMVFSGPTALAHPEGPVASTAGRKVYVNAGGFAVGGRSLKVRPKSMHLLSNENLGSLRWSHWGGTFASGRGSDYSNDPSPGHKRKNPVRVKLRGRKKCGHRLVYTKVQVHFTDGVPYKGQPHTGTINFGCPM